MCVVENYDSLCSANRNTLCLGHRELSEKWWVKMHTKRMKYNCENSVTWIICWSCLYSFMNYLIITASTHCTIVISKFRKWEFSLIMNKFNWVMYILSDIKVAGLSVHSCVCFISSCFCLFWITKFGFFVTQNRRQYYDTEKD